MCEGSRRCSRACGYDVRVNTCCPWLAPPSHPPPEETRMPSRLIRFGGYFATCALLLNCSEAPSGDDDDNGGSGNKAGSGMTKGGSAGTPSTGGMTSLGGASMN